jgi:hypothetical protein
VVWYARALSPVANTGLHTRRSVVFNRVPLNSGTVAGILVAQSDVGWFQEEH